ncbi:Dicer-like protein 4 [Camellia lanceoleosa]|uniref:Dicer-like protein 4 n=1 Tax=Camellia lanceoleosa TaxID=1840588 RepID=A0ACC0I206_9ERIC|nr:Dicer-like protein 4 [Camellia lanceoleosa]
MMPQNFPVYLTSCCHVTISGASINTLETLLHSKVYSVEDKEELEQFVASPKFKIYYYGPCVNNSSSPHMIYYKNLEEIKHQFVSTLSTKTDDLGSLKSTKKMLRRLHNNLIFCLENLGVWGAFQACDILLKGDCPERNELIAAEGNGDDISIWNRYLAQAASVFARDCKTDGIEADLSCVEVLKEPLFSKKLLQLIGILSTFRNQSLANIYSDVNLQKITGTRSTKSRGIVPQTAGFGTRIGLPCKFGCRPQKFLAFGAIADCGRIGGTGRTSKAEGVDSTSEGVVYEVVVEGIDDRVMEAMMEKTLEVEEVLTEVVEEVVIGVVKEAEIELVGVAEKT